MNKNVMNKIGLAGIIALIITMFIACDDAGSTGNTDSTGGDPDSIPPITPPSLYAWGFNDSGQLGTGNTTNSVSPIKIGDNTWKQVSTSGKHTVAIDSADKLYAWGDNGNGQLGIGTETVEGNEVLVDKNAPFLIGDNTWKQVSAGLAHTVAIDSAGKLYAWGSNTNGRLGIGTETVKGNEVLVDKNAPFLIGDNTWKQVSAGLAHTVAIDSAGKLYAWGQNSFGQLGIGNANQQNTPVAVVIGEDTTQTWKQVSAGGFAHTVAIDSDNHLYAWGFNGNGQLGTGNTNNTTSPVKIGTKTWKQVSVGDWYTAAIDSADNLYTWGKNDYGQLGSENTNDSTAPVKRGDNTWKQVSAGFAHTVAIDSDDYLYAWGANTYGQLGDGKGGNGVKSTSPIKIGDKTWNQVSAGKSTTLGIIQ